MIFSNVKININHHFYGRKLNYIQNFRKSPLFENDPDMKNKHKQCLTERQMQTETHYINYLYLHLRERLAHKRI